MKKREKYLWKKSTLVLLTLAAVMSVPTWAMKECEGVAFAPVSMVVTRADD